MCLLQLSTLRGAVLEDAIPASGRVSSSRGVPVKDLLEFLVPEVQTSCLRQATAGQKTSDQLMKLDEQRVCSLLAAVKSNVEKIPHSSAL